MLSLKALSNLAKVLLLAGALMFVFGAVRLISPYSASAKVDGYTQSCGSVLAPKHTVATINCNRGGNVAWDLFFVIGGVALATGTALLFGPEPATPGPSEHPTDRSGAYG